MNGESGPLPEVPISALQHFSYCPRQCALIHVEQTYEENLFTIRGRLEHQRTDSGQGSHERGVRVLRALPIWSERWGIVGKADVVEMHANGPIPVEYKSGRSASRHADVQLCAQAFCLEEMFQAPVNHGEVFTVSTRRRARVLFGEELRKRTSLAIQQVRALLNEQALPPAPNDGRCPRCSLVNACLPSVVAEKARVRGLQGALFVPLKLPERDDD